MDTITKARRREKKDNAVGNDPPEAIQNKPQALEDMQIADTASTVAAKRMASHIDTVSYVYT